ncbi:MAG: M1 family peptidase [Anaerolineales bacterium]|nr:M1 family peptidase [Anaerolineales bacterium]
MNFDDPHSFSDLQQSKITHIDLQFEVDFEQQVLAGVAQYTLDRPIQGSLFLDTYSLEIPRIHSGETDLVWEFDSSDSLLGDRLHIKDLRNEDAFTIIFRTGSGSKALQWLNPEQTAGGEHPYLFSQCQSIHARSIFPCQDTPSLRFTYDARVSVPNPLSAVMAAAPDGKRDVNGMTVFHFKMPQRIPSYLFAIAVGNITSKDLGPRCRIYAEPEVIDAAAWEFADIETQLKEAEAHLGAYVWDRYDMLVMPPSFPFGGMENPRLTFLSPTLLVGDRSMTSIATHELAHSWTGNLVTNATWEDFWLNEGWTVYAERRLLEVLESDAYANLEASIGYEKMLDSVEMVGMDSDLSKLKVDLRETDPIQNVTWVPYEKGYLFLVRVEQVVGRERFDSFVKKYIETFSFQSITTEEFLTFLKKELPGIEDQIDLHTWVYDVGIPEDTPKFSSILMDEVNNAVNGYNEGRLPTEDEVSPWRPSQIELFLRLLPEEIPIEDCRAIETLFHFKESRNFLLLTNFYRTAIRSGYEEVLPSVEELLASNGRMLFVNALYVELARASWSEGQVREIFERYKSRYHPLAAMSIDRMLSREGV